MPSTTSSDISKILLGAALAGLSCYCATANAATIYTETTDFEDYLPATTDLSLTFSDFSSQSIVYGSISTGTVYDPSDSFMVSFAPGELVSIPFTVISDGTASVQFTMYALEEGKSSGDFLAVGSVFTSATPGESVSGSIDFTTPANGKLVFYTETEVGNTTFNYSVGSSVPEPATGLLSLAGLATAALQRRRKSH